MRSDGLRWEMAWRREGSIVAPGARKRSAGGVRAARWLGRLREASGAVTAAALGVLAAVAWWRCRGRSAATGTRVAPRIRDGVWLAELAGVA